MRCLIIKKWKVAKTDDINSAYFEGNTMHLEIARKAKANEDGNIFKHLHICRIMPSRYLFLRGFFIHGVVEFRSNESRIKPSRIKPILQ